MSDAAQPATEVPAWKRPWLGGDGARGLGALMVFMAHIAFAEGTYAGLGWTDLPGRDANAIFGGPVGLHAVFSPARLVNLFFAFSAYLLARPFIAAALGRGHRPGTRNFFIRRALRLMPGYWVLCGLVVLWLVVLKGGSFDVTQSIKTFLVLDGGLTHASSGTFSWMAPLAVTWTVRVEALGYLLLPLLGWIWLQCGRRWGMRGLVWSLVVITVLTFFLRFHNLAAFPYPLLDGPAVMQWLFVPGLAVALIEAHDPWQRWWARRRRLPTLWLAIVGFLLLIGSEPASQAIIQEVATQDGPLPADPQAAFAVIVDATRAGTWLTVPMQVLGAGLLLLCLLAVEWQGGRPPWRLDGPVMRWVGLRSYSFYLVHFPVLGLLLPHVAAGEKGLLGYAALGAASLVVSLTAAAVLYRFVEQPGIALAQRLTGRKPGPLGGAPSPGATASGSPDAAGGPASVTAASAPEEAPVDEARELRRRMRVFEAGDAVRGWGLLLVITWHLAGFAVALRFGTPVPDFAHYGRSVGAGIEAFQASVWLFFGLSAYLLARPFAAAAFGLGRRPPMKRYVAHRVGRVGPALWAVITICLLLYGTAGASFGEVTAMYGFAQVWAPAAVNAPVGHAWSIDVEVAYYLVLPIAGLGCAWLMRRWPGRVGGGLAIAVIVAIGALGLTFAATWLPSETPPMHSPIGAIVAFIPGVAVAIAEVRWGILLSRWPAARGVGAVLAIAGVVVFYKMSSWTTIGSTEAIAYNAVAAGLIVAGLVLWQLTGSATWAPLRWSVPRWLGERSYSIFMGHGIIAYELRDVGTDAGSLWGHFLLYEAIALPLSIAFGAILFQLFELPAMRWSRGERPLWGGGHEVTGFEADARPRTATASAPGD